MGKPLVFRIGHHSQVLKPVVIADAVDVMDHMSFRNRAMRLLPDKSVFSLQSSPVHDDAVSTVIEATSDRQAAQDSLTYLLARLRGRLPPKAAFITKGCLAQFLSCLGRDRMPKLCLPIFLQCSGDNFRPRRAWLIFSRASAEWWLPAFTYSIIA